MKLCTSKNVPFLNKNIPKLLSTKSYTYNEPISKEAEADLVSSFANICLCDTKKPIILPAVLTTPMIKRPANRKSLIFEENSSSDEEESIENNDLSALRFGEEEEMEEVDPEVAEIIPDILSIDEDPEFISAASVEKNPIVFTDAEDNKTNNDNSSDSTPDDLGSVSNDGYISDAIPVSDSEDDESDDDTFDAQVERIFLFSAPPLRIGSAISFRQRSMQYVRSI